MTLATTTNKIIYNGLIGQDTFAYNFRVDNKVDMEVYLSAVLIDQGDWTIDGLGEQIGGNVILNTPLASDQSVTLLRNVPENQLTDYQPFDAFPAETHEDALDKLTMLVQEVQENVDRLNLPPVDTIPDGSGDITVQGDLTIEEDLSVIGTGLFGGQVSGIPPTADAHLTRKDYVDDAIAANNLALYPIGSHKIGPDPTSAIGGTWSQLPEGTFLMNTVAGADVSGGSNDAVVIAHTHTYTAPSNSGNDAESGGERSTDTPGVTGSTGVDGTDLNKPLYVGVEVWERTA